MLEPMSIREEALVLLSLSLMATFLHSRPLPDGSIESSS
jgi:hypothetical protein